MTSIGLSVEILDLNDLTPVAWNEVVSDVKSVASNGNGMLASHSPSPSPGNMTITLENSSGDYSSGETIIAQGNPIRVRVKSELGKCLRVYHTGTTAASYLQNTSTGAIPGSAVLQLTWKARCAFDSKWNTDTPYIQDGGTQYISDPVTYTNEWETYTFDVPSATGDGFSGVVFQPDRTGAQPYQYTEYKDIVLTVNGTPVGDLTPEGGGWSVYNPGGGVYHLSVVDDMYILWQGFIENVRRKPLVYAARTVTLECIDFITRLQRGRMNAPLQRNKRADELINVALEYMASNPAASWKAWSRTSGARRYYPLGEAVGATTAVDYGSDGLDSTFLTGVTFGSDGLLENGDTATSATFSSGRIILQPIELTRSFTLLAEINLLAGPDPQPVISFYDDGDNIYELRLAPNSDADLIFQNNLAVITASNALTYNASHLIAATFDYGSSTLTLYADGVSVASGTITAVSVTTAGTLVGQGVDSGYHVGGKIQNVMIFDTCLSDADILAAYNATQFSEAKQKRWFPGIQIEEGRQTFSVAYDEYTENEVTPFAAIEDATNSEAGRFYMDRTTLRFRNRDWWQIWRERLLSGALESQYRTLILNAALDGEIGDPFDVEASEGGEKVINRVLMQYTPRTENSETVVLASQQDTIPPLVSGTYGTAGAVPGEKEVTLTFHNESGKEISGYDFVTPLVPWHSGTPLATYDVRVWGDQTEMEAGTDYTPGGDDPLNRGRFCEYTITSLTPRQMKIKFRNFAIGNLYIYVQVRGKSITAFDPITVEEKRQDLIDDANDERAYPVPLPFVNDSNFARAYAQYYMSTFSTSFEQFDLLSFKDTRVIRANDYMTEDFDLLSLRIGDVVGFINMENFYYHLVVGVDYLIEPNTFEMYVRLARADRPNVRAVGSGATVNENIVGI